MINLIMKMEIIPIKDIPPDMNYDFDKTIVIGYNWGDIVKVKHIPSNTIQSRKVVNISLYDDLIWENNEWCRILHVISK